MNHGKGQTCGGFWITSAEVMSQPDRRRAGISRLWEAISLLPVDGNKLSTVLHAKVTS